MTYDGLRLPLLLGNELQLLRTHGLRRLMGRSELLLVEPGLEGGVQVKVVSRLVFSIHFYYFNLNLN